jgi:hypothetical protein
MPAKHELAVEPKTLFFLGLLPPVPKLILLEWAGPV